MTDLPPPGPADDSRPAPQAPVGSGAPPPPAGYAPLAYGWTEPAKPVRPAPAGPLGPTGMPLASFGQRTIGYLIDFLVLLPVAIASFVLARHHSHAGIVIRNGIGYQRRVFERVPPVEVLALAVPVFLYDTLMIGLAGRTLGQRARNLKVIRAVDGSAPGYGLAVVRWAVVATPSIVARLLWLPGPIRTLASFWSIFALLWMAWDKRRQGLHDKAAGVLVVVDPT